MKMFVPIAVLFLAGMTQVSGAAQENPDVSSLTVTGRAVMSAVPDQAVIRLGVTRQSPTAQEAQKEASSAVQNVLKSIRGFVTDSKNLQTSQLTLFPVYSEQRPEPMYRGEPKVVGYRASNIVSATVQDLQKVGPLVDAAVKAGANQVERIQFQLKDDTAVREKALAAAAADARRKAQVIATSLGVRIVGIREISEGSVSVRPVGIRAEFMAAAADVSTPVEPGSINVEAVLTVRYQISE